MTKQLLHCQMKCLGICIKNSCSHKSSFDIYIMVLRLNIDLRWVIVFVILYMLIKQWIWIIQVEIQLINFYGMLANVSTDRLCTFTRYKIRMIPSDKVFFTLICMTSHPVSTGYALMRTIISILNFSCSFHLWF